MAKGEEILGEIKIKNEVVGSIANLAAQEILGITSGSGRMSLTEMFGKKDTDKGVVVEIEGNNALINIDVTIDFGINMYEAANEIQKRVKDSVEQMTGLVVDKVNVNINGINFPKKDKKLSEESEKPV